MKLLPIVAIAGVPALALLFLIDRDDEGPTAATASPGAVTTPAREVAPPTARVVVTPVPQTRTADAVAPAAPIDPDDPRWARNDPQLDFFTSEIRDSGAPSGAWSALPDQVIATWQAGLEPELAGRVRFAPFECYRRGCITAATYHDEASYQELNDSLPELEAFRHFPGWRHRSAPSRDSSGRVTVTWVFMSPAQS